MEAAESESTVSRGMTQYGLLAAQVAEKESRLVELQRLRSRIVTGRITDEELAEMARREAEAKAAAEAAAAAARADTLQPMEQPISPTDTLQAEGEEPLAASAADTLGAASTSTEPSSGSAEPFEGEGASELAPPSEDSGDTPPSTSDASSEEATYDGAASSGADESTPEEQAGSDTQIEEEQPGESPTDDAPTEDSP